MSAAALRQVEHVVVLMLENRSFDHMLGYLSIDGVLSDVDGLAPEMSNLDANGVEHPVAELGARFLHDKVLDPGHGRADTATQIDGGSMGGFVRNFAEAFRRNLEKHARPPGLVFDPGLVMGYQRAEQVPVYDYLARNYVVCDRWFSSVPGPTWPNRLYAVTGGESPPDRPSILGWVPPPLRHAPIFDRVAFTRFLDDTQWRWYSFDPATLRLIDSRYRPGGDPGAGDSDNFAYFNRTTTRKPRSFVDDARDGTLPDVAWIDPNFVDFRLAGPPGSNDDHPPSRVMLGQELVLATVAALAANPERWSRTLLLITYDEHGGFYDHVNPLEHPVAGDPPETTYGVRVPALVVSPLVRPGVSHVVFDHTSIVRTILERFCAPATLDRALAQMGSRTQHANHLGALLAPDPPRPAPPAADLRGLLDAVTAWKHRAYAGQMLEEPTLGERGFGLLTDLQKEVLGGAMALRGDALPPDSP